METGFGGLWGEDNLCFVSKQAKGKIERPYRWIQDRLVRTCYRENIRDIKKGQLILNNLLQRYNYRIVHSTTGEIP